MPPKTKKQKSTKVKKKTWYEIVAPASFNSAQLGETAAFESADLPGRTLTLNLMALTNDIKSQNVNVKFKIDKVTGSRAVAIPIGYELMPAHIKRMVRRRRDRIDDVFMAKTKEGTVVSLKLMVMTRNHTTNSVQTAIRHDARLFIFNQLKKREYDTVFSDIIFNKLQRELRSRLSKIYPIRSAEVRMIRLEESKKFEQPDFGKRQSARPRKEDPAEAEEKQEKAPAEEKAPSEEEAPKQEKASPKKAAEKKAE